MKSVCEGNGFSREREEKRRRMERKESHGKIFYGTCGKILVEELVKLD